MKKNFYIILVFLLIALEVVLITSIAFFNEKKIAQGNIMLGELDFNVETKFEPNMYALPNSSILCFMNLKNTKENGEYNNLIDFYFRFKIEGICNNKIIYLIPNFLLENWYFDNEYYYYKNIVHKNENVGICNNVIIDKNTGNFAQGQFMEINVCFEAIQYNAVSELWGEMVLKNLNNF